MPLFDAHTPAIRDYYTRRAEVAKQGATKETSIRDAFATLLTVTGKAHGLTFIAEARVEGLKRVVLPDGTLRDGALPRGYWEAKDPADDLEAEIGKKFARDYPRSNIIFEDTRRAILYQNKQRIGEYDLTDPAQLALLLNTFYSHTEPAIEDFKQAVEKFKLDTPELARGLQDKVSESHRTNKAFQEAFAAFMDQCRRDLNPKITQEQVDDMLIQHLLTERIIRSLFQSDFARRNVIAAEVEKVITALTSKNFDPKEYLGKLDYFYQAIESAAKTLPDFTEKQTFLNSIYEQFFQKYSFKVADTHGIVYTPQPIVEFMVALVEDALHREFGYGLDHPHVCLIDPCTGTGNFIVQLLKRMALRSFDPNDLLSFYRDRLFANEIMLLPYYIASLNIERTFYELTGEYRSFDGLCFVDTLDLAKKKQQELTGFLSEKNAARVERQQRAPITVIIGNPPYNVGQQDENDNNQNRTYEAVEHRLRETYVRDSKATLRRQLYDPYVKFFRWASDRLQGRDGIVCYVTNNSFVDQVAFDGMRKHLLQDFTHVYHLDLHGNVRQNPKISGTSHNVFGIQVGVGITLAIKSQRTEGRGLYYHRVPEMDRREQKLALLSQITSPVIGETLQKSPQMLVTPDAKYNWQFSEHADEFMSFIAMGSKESKAVKGRQTDTIFKTYTRGVATNADDYIYDFDKIILIQRATAIVKDYRNQLGAYLLEEKRVPVEEFIEVDPKVHKWIRRTKKELSRGTKVQFQTEAIRLALYRPFTKKFYYFERVFNEDVYQQPRFFPNTSTEQENRVVVVGGYGRKPFAVMMTNHISDVNFYGDPGQCFPFYVYDEDGSNRRENITDWALKQFQDHYADPSISKWDIFYYVYAALHSPAYREKFAANLKRDLPRLPFYPSPNPTLNPSPRRGEGSLLPTAWGGREEGSDAERGGREEGSGFWQYAQAGRQLADLHVNYESAAPYDLKKMWETPPHPSPLRKEGAAKKMSFTRDKTGIKVNDHLTLTGIPSEAHGYVLGSRSALAWLVDQYPAPSSEAAPALMDLIARVTTVSVETVRLVAGLG